MLVDPSQHPRDGFHKQLHKALNRHLHMLKDVSSRLIQRLRRLLQVLDSLLELPRLGEGNSRGDGGNHGL
jgi:hypothetical protein